MTETPTFPIVVVWDDNREPVMTDGETVVQCDMDDDCHEMAHAMVCGSRCKCRVNVCQPHHDWMDSRFKCPFTGDL